MGIRYLTISGSGVRVKGTRWWCAVYGVHWWDGGNWAFGGGVWVLGMLWWCVGIMCLVVVCGYAVFG